VLAGMDQHAQLEWTQHGRVFLVTETPGPGRGQCAAWTAEPTR